MENQDAIHRIPGRRIGVNPLASLVFFAWILGVQLTGLGVFTKGFFLTRVELGKQSECDISTLLSKDELRDLSDAGRQHSRGKRAFLDETGCWLPPRFKRMVWVVIDALRYDFAAYNPEENAERSSRSGSHGPGAKYYINHLPVIREAISGTQSAEFEGAGGMLFQFEADPPTVTMQRLKGLTTGGLPTFIDFRDNFHSPEIEEDNWVAQIDSRARRRKASPHGSAGKGGGLVFMGDDTWTSLYPTYFTRSFPFPSFNTRDLHTVDDGVLNHLPGELENDDWTVLVAHFLGVDHVGHTFGPASPAMAEKLDQMDRALRNVFSTVDDDTLVLVLGDHGMTEDGNHGGATPDETGAALFIWSRSKERLLGSKDVPKRDRDSGYSPEGLDRTELRNRGIWEELPGVERDAESSTPLTRKVAQIDLVPTLSLLLGTPIPYGNLGGIIQEMFMGSYEPVLEESSRDGGRTGSTEGSDPDAGTTDEDIRLYGRLSDALLINSLQVWRYLSEYAKVASMPETEMQELERLLTAARDDHAFWRKMKRGGDPTGSVEDLRHVCDAYRTFLDAAIGLGRSLWTQYDEGLMCWGLITLLLATLALGLRVLSRQDVHASRDPTSGNASRWGAGHFALFWGAAGTAGFLLFDAVFGPSSFHALLAKVTCSSCLGVCWFYLQSLLSRQSGTENNVQGPFRDVDSTPGGRPVDGVAFGRYSASEGTNGVVHTAAPLTLAMVYCAGLFSNSFIEAEDQLHRFLGATSLLALAAVQALSMSLRSWAPDVGESGAIMTPPQPMAVTEPASKSPSLRESCHRDPIVGPILSRLWPGAGSTAVRVAAFYNAIAAACLRAAAAVQDASPGVIGLAPGASFGVLQSVVPVAGIWCLCCVACGGEGTLEEIKRWAAGKRLPRISDSAHRGPAVRSIGLSSWVLHGLLQALSFAAIGAYWIVEAMTSETTRPVGGGKAGDEGGSGSSKFALHSDDGILLGLGRPMRLLLPRVTYAICLIGLLLLAVMRPAPRSRVACGPEAPPPAEDIAPRSTRRKRRGDNTGQGYRDVEVCATTVAIVTSHMVPVVVLLLGPGSPLVVLLMACACACVVKSLSISAERGVTAAHLATVAVTWSIVGRAVFFLTGHHNQFSRLQYSAAFVGFEEFDFNVGGVLLFINTFGTEIVAAFALPLAAAAVAMKAPAARLGPGLDHGEEEGREEGQSTDDKPPGGSSDRQPLEVDAHAGEDGLEVLLSTGARGGKDPYGEGVSSPEIHDREHSSVSEFVSVMDRMSGVILLLSGARTFLSAANVSVQRGHLMLWAIFAPKFIFDATMQVVSGGAAIVVWAVVVASLGAISSGNLGGRHRILRASRRDTHAVSDDVTRKLDNESDNAAVLDSPWHPSTSAPGASTVESAPSIRLRRM